MNANSFDKLEMLKGSQKCFFLGLFSLVSLIGLPLALLANEAKDDPENGFFRFCYGLATLSLASIPLAVAALVLSFRARQHEKNYWNAAKYYRWAGFFCAIAALLASGGVALLTASSIVDGTLLHALFPQ